MASKKTTTTRTRSPRTVRTKAEVQTDFEDIRSTSSSQEPVDPKSAAAARAYENDVRSRTAGLSVEKAVEDVTKVNLSISRTLSDVSQKLSETVAELQTVTEAVALKRQELETLHNIDIAQTSLDALLADYDTKTKEFEAQTKTAREAWFQEAAQHAAAVKERDADLQKTRQREQDDYNYKLNVSRTRAKDEMEAEFQAQRKADAARQEELEKDWKRREEALAAREAEFTKLKAEVEAFPALLKAEIGKHVGMTTSTLTKDFENKSALVASQADADKKVLTYQIQSLTADVNNKSAEITALRSALDQANARVQEIAKSAFDATSGQLALDKVTQLTSQNGNGNGSRPKA